MQMLVYHLHARSPFHFGDRGIGVEATELYARADTLFSALCVLYREWQGSDALEAMLAAFATQPPFLLSSAFPMAQAGDQVLRFYPRPLGAPPGLDPDDLDGFKRVKRVAFLSESIFLRWVGGDPRTAAALALIQDKSVAVSVEELKALKGLPLDAEGLPRLWEQQQVPRVTVDRINSASTVFQGGRMHYAPGGGLWVGFTGLVESGWQERLETLLLMLGDSGLGGERSVGHGQFSVSGPETVGLPDNRGRAVTLAPVWPGDQAISLLGGGDPYALITRRGWIGSPEGGGLRRKAVRMLAEGSILRSDGLAGGLVDLTPEAFAQQRADAHPVYRYGWALPVGITGG